MSLNGIRLSTGTEQASYDKLRKAFPHPDAFRAFEWELQFALEGIQNSSRPRPDRWRSAVGMTRKQFAGLPGKFEKTASAIENLIPRTFRSTGLSSAPFTIDDVERLPGLLRSYARFIDAEWKKLDRLFSKRPRLSNRRWAVYQLVLHVRFATGKPMYSDLANVLTGAARSLKVNDSGLDVDSLKTLYASMQ